MNIQFENNPGYRPAFTSTVTGTIYYEPAGDTAYHLSRVVAASAQNVYSSAGITPELLTRILDEMEKAVNASKLSDVAVWINNIRYRTRYPVDEDAALRMALLMFFVEGEDPAKPEPHWTERKMQLAKEDPAAYSFFMKLGLENTPAYKEYGGETFLSNFQKRREDLQSLIPVQ